MAKSGSSLTLTIDIHKFRLKISEDIYPKKKTDLKIKIVAVNVKVH
jgi:hypothetical protein